MFIIAGRTRWGGIMNEDIDFREAIEEHSDPIRKTYNLPDTKGLRILANGMEFLSYAAALVGSLLILGITFLITANVLSRKYFNESITGTLELTEYTLVWITFISAAWVLRQDGHVKVDILILILPRTVRKWFYYIAQVLGCLVCLFLTFYSAAEVYTSYLRGLRLINQLIIQKWIVLSVIPIGFFMLSIEFVLLILRGPTRQFLTDRLT